MEHILWQWQSSAHVDTYTYNSLLRFTLRQSVYAYITWGWPLLSAYLATLIHQLMVQVGVNAWRVQSQTPSKRRIVLFLGKVRVNLERSTRMHTWCSLHSCTPHDIALLPCLSDSLIIHCAQLIHWRTANSHVHSFLIQYFLLWVPPIWLLF